MCLICMIDDVIWGPEIATAAIEEWISFAAAAAPFFFVFSPSARPRRFLAEWAPIE